MQPRHRARIITIQALFEIDMTGHDAEAVLAERLQGVTLPERGTAFARDLLFGVLAYQSRLDEIIQSIAPDWPVGQVAIIDRNILRIAIYEIIIAETPHKVAINEAVELTKLFGSDSSRRFMIRARLP